MSKPTKIRKNYRLAPHLVKWVQKQARKEMKSETELVEQALTMLKVSCEGKRHG
jgi:hypothetical protein